MRPALQRDRLYKMRMTISVICLQVAIALCVTVVNGKIPIIIEGECNGPNEVYNSCGTACEVTCANRLNPPQLCMDVCNPGCFCLGGYFRNSAGICVPEIQCDSVQCDGLNEEFNSCGTYCEVTCANRHEPPRPCVAACNAKCFCKPGYLRNSAGVCVPESQCERKCYRPNETYNSCGSYCPLTCANQFRPPKVCNKGCNPGCFCNAGYLRNSAGNCVLKRNCDKELLSEDKQTINE
ncbi:serine protease inhibitor swm-1 isoform X2 [Bombina bombina]|uniref:serine protease inhibitor swm-1 isoform X2 n=1 Tax=Bombina bombina TaxID=8345 RepID=UPI00235AF863|nr:serine protease inhibitor swm-1 isoform X2 [Bombina bombina]